MVESARKRTTIRTKRNGTTQSQATPQPQQCQSAQFRRIAVPKGGTRADFDFFGSGSNGASERRAGAPTGAESVRQRSSRLECGIQSGLLRPEAVIDRLSRALCFDACCRTISLTAASNLRSYSDLAHVAPCREGCWCQCRITRIPR